MAKQQNEKWIRRTVPLIIIDDGRFAKSAIPYLPTILPLSIR